MDKVIVKITDKDFNLPVKELKNPVIRYGARGLVFNDKGELAIFHKQLKNEYKLPGGGIEENEKAKEAFKREIMEETGCSVYHIKEIGLAIEEKGQTNFCQISHVFQAKVYFNSDKLHLTDKELAEGGKLIWLSPIKAYQKVLECINNVTGSVYDDRYRTLFMVKRDAAILKYYLDQEKN